MEKKTESTTNFFSFSDNSNDLLSQLPGLVVWKTEDSKYLWCNSQGAIQLGFKKQKEVLGITDDKIKCPAAECAEAFIAKDKEAIAHGDIELIDINTWADNRRMVSYSKKNKFYYHDINGNKKTGVLFYSTEISDGMLLRLERAIDKNINKKLAFKKSYYYEIKNDFSYLGLTYREAQCLFFLSRGYTAKMIGNILNISNRTVEAYIDNMKLKLNMHTKTDLIDFAYSSGFVITLPKSIFKFLLKSEVFD